MILLKIYYYNQSILLYFRNIIAGYRIDLIRDKYEKQNINNGLIPLFRGIAIIIHKPKPATSEECKRMIFQPNFLSNLSSLRYDKISYSTKDYSQLVIIISQIKKSKSYNVLFI